MPESTQISIIIPTYNYASTLPRAIKSVLSQMTDQHELIVVDDGSTDETPQTLRGLQNSETIQFRVIRKPNGGAASARNLGIQESCGKYLFLLDSDDELTANALKLLSTYLNTQPETKFIIAGHWTISPDGKQNLHLPNIIPEDPVKRLRWYLIDKRIAISHGACIMHRNIFGYGNYPEHFRNAEDIPVFAQALANFPCSCINQPFVRIHKHDDSLRHQFAHTKEGGLALVDETFSPQRLGSEFQILKTKFYVTRYLSLFRSAYIAGETTAAKEYFINTLKLDWRVLFKGSYIIKAVRLWLK